VRFRGDLTERREKLMQKTASVPVSFMEKGFYTTYTQWDWFCFGAKPFNPYDISDEGTMVGAFGTASGQGATLGMCEADLPLQYKGNY
jgi:hypothetical protein